MKKTLKSILIATLSVFAFTCCEDVPAPYQIPEKEEKVPDKVRQRLFYVPVQATFLTPEDESAFTEFLVGRLGTPQV